jgi:effector-binding domain-containing protein/uncharacterized protein YndB with AHSA1/START domain
MKTLLKVLGIIAVIVIVVCIVALIALPSHMHVERTAVINQPPDKVFNYINDFHNNNSWSPWYEKDTLAKYEYEGAEKGVGSILKWESDSDKVGKGKMVITESKPDSVIRLELYFMDDNKPAIGTYTFVPEGTGTKMTWALDADAGMNPFKRIMGKFFIDKFVGPEFEHGLANIQKNSDRMSAGNASDIKIEEVTVTAQPYIAIRDTASIPTISMKLGKSYSMLGEAMGKQKLQMAGAPFAIYYSDSETAWEFDAAIPVNSPGKADENIKPGSLPAGNAVVAHYFGAYDNLGVAHKAVDNYIAKNNKEKNGSPWEVYLTDPGAEKDTAKWQTDVYYPVK